MPRFWRDETLPFIEARSVEDGRKVCYARHTHEHFSIGTIMTGHSTYVYEHTERRVEKGAVVLMNPGAAHACNPVSGERWSYRMFYVDLSWLAGLQHDLGLSRNSDFHAFATTLTPDPALYAGLNRLYGALCDRDADALHKQGVAVEVFCEVQRRIGPALPETRGPRERIRLAAEYIQDNYAGSLRLEDVCAAAGLSQAYLIRAFKRHYGMTPHAYLLDCRIRRGKEQLRRGGAIADVALATGFADQAHFQRAFKRFVAATPKQYRTATV